MFKKYINSLLYEEQRQLISNNETLLNQCREIWLEQAGFWIDEYLQGCTGCNYSISYGFYSYGDYFTIEDGDKAIEWLEDNQNTFGFLSDSDYKIVLEYKKTREIYKHVAELFYYGYSPYTGKYGNVKQSDFYKVESKDEKLQHEIESIVLKRLRSEVDYWIDDENVIAEGLDEWLIQKYSYGFCNDSEAEQLFTDYKLTHIYENIPEVTIPAHTETII